MRVFFVFRWFCARRGECFAKARNAAGLQRVLLKKEKEVSVSPRVVGIGSGPDSRCGATDDALMNRQASALFRKTREMNVETFGALSLC